MWIWKLTTKRNDKSFEVMDVQIIPMKSLHNAHNKMSHCTAETYANIVLTEI